MGPASAPTPRPLCPLFSSQAWSLLYTLLLTFYNQQSKTWGARSKHWRYCARTRDTTYPFSFLSNFFFTLRSFDCIAVSFSDTSHRFFSSAESLRPHICHCLICTKHSESSRSASVHDASPTTEAGGSRHGGGCCGTGCDEPPPSCEGG